ncbi:MAG: hypothetical protein WC334_02490, partial [Kiritimatiellales bacterium]
CRKILPRWISRSCSISAGWSASDGLCDARKQMIGNGMGNDRFSYVRLHTDCLSCATITICLI